jgi:hypothetical protein
MDNKDESPKPETEALTETAPAPAPVASETTPPAAPTETTVEPEIIPAPGILARISTAISRAFSANPKRTGPALTMAMILDTAGGQHCFVSDSALAQFRAWQKRHDVNLNFMLAADPTPAWLRHQKSIQDTVEAGTSDDSQAHSREEFIKSHQQKIEAARLNLEKIYLEAWPLCAAVAARCIEAAELKAQKREQQERDDHARYGVAYPGTSAIVKTLRAAIEMARVRSKKVEGGRASPQTILPYLDF